MAEPLSRFIEGPGIFTARTDWGSQATQLLVVAGTTTESHQDRAQGSFLISAGGDWLAGSAKLLSHSGIRQEVQDHNCVQINGNRQTWTQDAVRFLHHEDTPLTSYAAASLTGAYEGQVTAYTREILWVKPGLFVVRDTLASVPAVWNLNVLNQPVLGAPPITFAVQGDHDSQLFGASALPFGAQAVPLEDKQTRPSYRLSLSSSTGVFQVGLEVAAKGAARTVIPFSTPKLAGMSSAAGLAAFALAEPPLSYPSPGPGTHAIAGLTPGQTYTVAVPGLPNIIPTASPGGVIAFVGRPQGTLITITPEGTPDPGPGPGPGPSPGPPSRTMTILSGTLIPQSGPSITLIGGQLVVQMLPGEAETIVLQPKEDA